MNTHSSAPSTMPTCSSPTPPVGDGNDVQLFTIPEPASLALFVLGGALILPRHLKRGSVC